MTWYRITVEWTDRVPDARELGRMNEILQRLDYDAPEVDHGGSDGFWRHPLVPPAVAINVLHAFGYPCRARWVHDRRGESDDDELDEALRRVEWIASSADLVGLSARDAAILLSLSRRFAKHLERRPREPRRLPCGSRGQRRRGRLRVEAELAAVRRRREQTEA